jgi:hypothetical protein
VTRVAQVGAFKRMTHDDQMRILTTLALIGEKEPGFLKGFEAHNDIVNLAYGRDFLEERRHYDVVIVHSVLSPKLPMKGLWRLRSISLLISRHHTLKRWRSRLVSTGARMISVCELLPATLNGWELGELPGYKILSRDGRITLYRGLS